MKNFLLVNLLLLLVVCLWWIPSREKAFETKLIEFAEQAYFEGQKDALNEDIRIEWDDENDCWGWIKSPWDTGDPATFDPKGIPLK